MNNTTPTTLASLRYQDNVITLKHGQAVDTIARKFFKECFEFEGEPSIHYLFTEDGKRVYESYVDSGSVDYLYIIK